MKKYRFYFEYQKDGEQHTVEIKSCKAPTRTKVYKTLENNFNEGFIEVYGYELVK